MTEENSLPQKTKTQQVGEMIVDSLTEVSKDSSSFQKILSIIGNKPNYSVENIALLYAQMPEATMVQGVAQWNKIGRNVIKGSSGIYIYTPNYKNERQLKLNSDGTPELNEQGKKQYEIIKVETGMNPIKMFDLSQTKGKAIDVSKDIIHSVRTGQMNLDYEKLYNIMKAAMANKNGLTITDNFDQVAASVQNRTVNGLYEADKNMISIDANLSGEEKFKTLTQEFTNYRLKNGKSTPEQQNNFAASVAYSVAAYYGLETEKIAVEGSKAWFEDIEQLKTDLEGLRSLTETTIRSVDHIILDNHLELTSQEVAKDSQALDQLVNEIEESNEPLINEGPGLKSLLAEEKKSLIEFTSLINKDYYQNLFTEAIDPETVEHFEAITQMENPPYFEFFDIKARGFTAGQFTATPDGSFELSLINNQLITKAEFEEGNYLVTNQLTTGINPDTPLVGDNSVSILNFQAKMFHEQFYLQENEQNKTVDLNVNKMNGEPYTLHYQKVNELNDISEVKAYFDNFALDRTKNHAQTISAAMRRFDYAMNRDIRSNLERSHSVIGEQLHREERSILDRRLVDVKLPNDRNNILLLGEYLRTHPFVDSFDRLQEDLTTNNQFQSERLQMHLSTYNIMIANAINQIADENIKSMPSSSSVFEDGLYEKIGQEVIKVTPEFLEQVESIEQHLNIEEESLLDGSKRFANEIIEDKGLENCSLKSMEKVITKYDDPHYILSVVDKNNETRNLLVADSTGNIPYMGSDKNFNLEKALAYTGGIQSEMLMERMEKNLAPVEMSAQEKKDSPQLDDDLEL